MKQSNGKTRVRTIVTLSTIAFALVVVVLLSATQVAAQGCVSSSGTTTQPDHLKCYRVGADPFINTDLLSLNSPQFGVEPSCQVDGHAIQFCVPVCKTIIGPVPPPTGTGFVGQPLTDDYLCYAIRCAQNNAPKKLAVEDQFAARTIPVGMADILCAPAEKLTPPPPCGSTETTPPTAAQCGGACPDDQACKFTPPKKSATGVIPATCACAQSTTPCGNTAPPGVAPKCGGFCPPTTSGAEQLCRDLGGACTCTPF
jgi:hypothetical protein